MAREGKAPAFQFYAADWLADVHVAAMTLEQRGAYIQLLAYCWREGRIPTDTPTLSRILGVDKKKTDGIWTVLAPRFRKDGSHGRLDKQRREARKHAELQSQAGSRGASIRWGRHSHPIISPMAKNSSASASASASATATAILGIKDPLPPSSQIPSTPENSTTEESIKESIVRRLCIELNVTGDPWARKEVDAAIDRSKKSARDFADWIEPNKDSIKGQPIRSVCAMYAPINGTLYVKPETPILTGKEVANELRARIERRSKQS